MSDEKPETWPLRPDESAYVTHGLCMVIADVVRDHGPDLSRRAMLELGSLATAAELFSAEVAHFFGSRLDDHDALEAMQERYVEEEKAGVRNKGEGVRRRTGVGS